MTTTPPPLRPATIARGGAVDFRGDGRVALDITAGSFRDALDRAADAYVNMRAQRLGLLPLSWSLVPGSRLSGMADDHAVNVLEQWATAFGLDHGQGEWNLTYDLPRTCPDEPGTVHFSGKVTLDGVPIIMRVWCIVDRAAYYRHDRGEFRARYES